MSEMIDRVARAVREEIVRQYRDDERGRCPAGAVFYEEHNGPVSIARAAIEAMRDPETEILGQLSDSYSLHDPNDALSIRSLRRAWNEAISAAIGEKPE